MDLKQSWSLKMFAFRASLNICAIIIKPEEILMLDCQIKAQHFKFCFYYLISSYFVVVEAVSSVC